MNQLCIDLRMVIPKVNTSAMRGKKRFYWDLVLNNFTDADCECVQDVFEFIGESYIVAKEIGESGTPHLQMMIKLKKGNYKSYILNSFKETCVSNRISIREGRNIDAMKAYCLKDGDICFKKNLENITSDRHDKKDEFNKRVKHMMLHNECLNSLQWKYIEEHMGEVADIYREMYLCTYCRC